MLFNHQTQKLLDEIYQLYSKITLKVLHIRIQKYHEHTDSSHDITKHLTKHVHYLVNKHQEATSKVTWKKSTFIVKNTSHVTTLDDYKNPNPPNIINPLSDYLKNKKYADSSHSRIADQLISSTWEHFHAAIREARQGNTKTAIMHVDVANFAMKEVAHFLSEEEYQNLHSDIEVVVEKLRKLHLQSE
ncbi:MAG: hypothetical protein WBN57_12400 [Gammaproteobacteria bacterium]